MQTFSKQHIKAFANAFKVPKSILFYFPYNLEKVIPYGNAFT